MALPSFRLLRPYAIYRIVYVGDNPTNPAPIVFPIYIGPAGGKMHALVLNPRNMSSFDIMNVVKFVKRMKQIPTAYQYNGRMMFRILKQYLPNIVRKCYRTYFITGVKRYALVSTGIVPKDVFTNAEKAISDIGLNINAQKTMLVKSLNLFTGTQVTAADIGRNPASDTRTQPKFYQPTTAAEPSARDATLTADSSTTTPTASPTTNTKPTSPTTDQNNNDGLEGYS